MICLFWIYKLVNSHCTFPSTQLLIAFYDCISQHLGLENSYVSVLNTVETSYITNMKLTGIKAAFTISKAVYHCDINLQY